MTPLLSDIEADAPSYLIVKHEAGAIRIADRFSRCVFHYHGVQCEYELPAAIKPSHLLH